MGTKLDPSDLQKAENRLLAKGCKKRMDDMWEVPIRELKIVSKYCFRKSRNSIALKSMAKDIGEKGIVNLPTAIYSIDTDEIVLAVGFGRVECLRLNNEDYVPCRIFVNEKIVPQEIFNLILSDNIHREDMKPLELALLFRTWMKDSGLSQKELAEKIHRSETYVSEILSPLTKLSEEEIEMVLTSELKRSQIMELAKIDDKAKRAALIEKKATVREIREVTNRQKNKGKEFDPRVFRISDKAAKTSLGNAKMTMTIVFPNVGWKNEDIVGILTELTEKLRESSEEDSRLIPESFNF